MGVVMSDLGALGTVKRPAARRSRPPGALVVWRSCVVAALRDISPSGQIAYLNRLCVVHTTKVAADVTE